MIGSNDTVRKTWMKILWIYIFDLIIFFLDYSFLYTNESIARICEWVNPLYLVQFLIIGVIGCVFCCKQRFREFSNNIFNRESLSVLLSTVIFILFVIIIGKTIGEYEINLRAVIHHSVFCYIFVGVTEEWIYRGFIVTQMKKIVNSDLIIIIVSAVLFSLMHLPSFFMNTENITFVGLAYRLLIPLLLGMVFAHIYLYNGNMFVLVLLHGSYNLISDIAFDSWYYVSYGICWLLLLGYSVYCYKKKDQILHVKKY